MILKIPMDEVVYSEKENKLLIKYVKKVFLKEIKISIHLRITTIQGHEIEESISLKELRKNFSKFGLEIGSLIYDIFFKGNMERGITIGTIILRIFFEEKLHFGNEPKLICDYFDRDTFENYFSIDIVRSITLTNFINKINEILFKVEDTFETKSALESIKNKYPSLGPTPELPGSEKLLNKIKDIGTHIILYDPKGTEHATLYKDRNGRLYLKEIFIPKNILDIAKEIDKNS